MSADRNADRLALLSEAELAALEAPDDNDIELDAAAADDPTDVADPADAPEAPQAPAIADRAPAAPAPPAQSPLPDADPRALENLAAAKQALAEEKANLRKRWSEGDIDTDEYEQARDALADKQAALQVDEVALKISTQAQQQAVQNTWLDAQRRFAAANPSLDLTKPVVHAAFGAVLAEVNQDPAAAALSDDAVLAEAYKRYQATFGAPAAPKPASAAKAAPTRDNAPRDVVPTLATSPAAAIEDTSSGEWAAMDRLAIAATRSTEAANAYEDAIRRMPEHKRAAYLSYSAG